MVTINKKIKVAALLFGLGVINVNAQTLSQAKIWFEKGNFEKAKPIFKKLVKQSPSNANYNFWYGACCYETGELNEGLPYLEKSAERKVINGYLYLSKAYYDLYRFDEAIENLDQHIYWLEKKKRDISEAESLMAKYRKGARMIRSTEMVTVIDSFVVDKERFLDAYKLSSQAGIINLIDNNTTTVSDTVDIIKNQNTEYINEMGDKKILSEIDENGLSKLYASVKLIDKWSNPQRLKGINDISSDLKFPFLDSDGTTLYLSADGEDSHGGYDIFITRADSEENTYFKPDNIGFPFNSAYNDYMYAIDDYNNLGWFASDRFQPEGKVCIYVFVPNDSKVVYNYESEDPQKMISLARLDNIALTQNDRDLVIKAKQRLAKVMYSTPKGNANDVDFTFIINDAKIYHSINDFSSKKAKELFKDMKRMEEDFNNLEKELEGLREKYNKSKSSEKDSMKPGILDKEKRIEELRNEIESISQKIRNIELEL